MEIGIFARTFTRPSLEEILDAVKAHDISTIQFNTLCVGLSDMPDELSDELCERIRSAVTERAMSMASLSGTFNMIHPDIEMRNQGLRQLDVLAAASRQLGTSVITLCTGTRNTESMWRHHPDNETAEAWQDLLVSMEKAARIGEEHDVTMAFEPEVANVVDSAQKARQLLDDIQSPHVKVVFDGANIFHKGELAQMHDILQASIELVADDIVLAHAKDLDQDGQAGHLAAGHGLLDYDFYLRQLQANGFDGPIILHGLTEEQVEGCVAFLHDGLSKVS